MSTGNSSSTLFRDRIGYDYINNIIYIGAIDLVHDPMGFVVCYDDADA